MNSFSKDDMYLHKGYVVKMWFITHQDSHIPSCRLLIKRSNYLSTRKQISKLDAVTTIKWIDTDKIMDICRKKSPHTKDKHYIVCLKINIVNVGVSTMITRRSRWICEKSRIYILHIMKFMWPTGWCLRPRFRIIKKWSKTPWWNYYVLFHYVSILWYIEARAKWRRLCRLHFMDESFILYFFWNSILRFQLAMRMHRFK